MEPDDEGEEGQPKRPKHPLTMFTSEGDKYFRLRLYRRSIEFYTSALEQDPKNFHSLIGRAKCNMQLGNLEQLVSDVDEALKLDPRCPEAKALKGEVEFFLGDFERACVTFYRGQLARPNYTALRLGQQLCRKAVVNAIGPQRKISLDDRDVQRMEELLGRKPDKDQGKVKPSKIFREDEKCLQVLLADEDLQSVHANCGELLDFVSKRRRLWGSYRPAQVPRSDKTKTPRDRSPIRGRKSKSVETILEGVKGKPILRDTAQPTENGRTQEKRPVEQQKEETVAVPQSLESRTEDAEAEAAAAVSERLEGGVEDEEGEKYAPPSRAENVKTHLKKVMEEAQSSARRISGTAGRDEESGEEVEGEEAPPSAPGNLKSHIGRVLEEAQTSARRISENVSRDEESEGVETEEDADEAPPP